jgi:SAM-dependent methyltransferase
VAAHPEALDPGHWDDQYQNADLPWETNRPCRELQRVVAEYHIRPCRALELGCGTGASAVWLAGRGFDVTAIDLSPVAITRARHRAAEAAVGVRFVTGDLTRPGLLKGAFEFFFDGGCFGPVRLADREGYFRTLRRVTRGGSLGLVLVGNAREPEAEEGPPVLRARDIARDWQGLFDIVHLREFLFDAPESHDKRYPGWSCLVRRRE